MTITQSDTAVPPAGTGDAVVTMRDVRVEFPGRRDGLRFWARSEPFVAVDGVDLDVYRGEILGLVGESGCGKTTLARCLVGMYRPQGEVLIEGRELSRRPDPVERRRVQLVFQDPYAALNPSIRIGAMLRELLLVNRLRTRVDVDARVVELLAAVELGPDVAEALPSGLSGGQRQRVNIARALALEPEVLVADEVVSALDASVQASVLNLLMDLRDELGLTIVFISHNLAVVRQICDRVAVMRAGRIVELADTEALFAAPAHEFTRQLLATVPRLREPLDDHGQAAPEAAGEVRP